MFQIMVVDDDRNTRRLLQAVLEADGYKVLTAENGEDALTLMDTEYVDLVVLDIMLPGVDGVELLRRIREQPELSAIPVVMATAKGAEYDKVQSLDLGADYYLTKPFGVMEFLACIRSVLRRCGGAEPGKVLGLQGVRMDLSGRTVTVDGERAALTYKEFELLRLFLIVTVDDHKQILLQFIGADLIQLCCQTLRLHLYTDRPRVRLSGADPQTENGVRRTGLFQREIQIFPRRQRGDPAFQPSLFALRLRQRSQLRPHRIAGRLCLFCGAGIQKFRFGDGMALDEHAVLQLGVLSDGFQRRVDVAQLALFPGQRRGSPLKQRCPLGIREDLLRLTDLHTAKMQQSF